MNDFTPLTRPLQSQVTIDAVAKECPSEGFNYPTFRQLNKKARVYLSTPINPQPSTSYCLFSVANSRGWFVAVKSASSGSELVFSPLDDLRSAFASAKEDDETLFTPKRVQSIPTKANIVKFACGDTRLLVGLEDGSVVVYDTSSLFTPGTNDVQPLGRFQVQSMPIRQILPNPGTEPGLSDIFAVVGDGKVQLLNMRLESQGGWVATDLMTQPIAVDWSPKGKHIAIGLQTGDILTYSPTNKSTPNKHIPPTVNSVLVSLNWLGPGHTFRTSYAAQGDSPATQHIITLDAKSSTATYLAPDHPFPSPDRTNQAAYVVSLPKWDTDPGSNEDKSLTVVGDISSVDLEVLGNNGNQWHRQSQENPLSLPLDKAMDDTVLLSLEVDLTDTSSAAPIMYAFLNDGSLQGWTAEHGKPYLGMIGGSTAVASAPSDSNMPIESHSGKDADMGSSTAEPAPAPAVSAFGQSSFGQQPQSTFGGGQQPSAFGQTGFAQQPSSAFGQSAFGQPSTFGALSGGFGQAPQPTTPTSAFDSVKPSVGFGAFGGGSTGAFGSGNAFGSSSGNNAFSAIASNTNTNAFGSGNFGSAVLNTASSGSPSPSPAMTREASMSDSTPGFGGLSLGSATPSDPNARNSMFGTFNATSTTTRQEATSSFGGSLVKPASGFGAFGNFKPATSFEPPKASTTTSTFSSTSQSSTTTATSGFGQSGFASSAFGKSSFGQPSFGKPSLGVTTPTAPASSGGFSAFAGAPASLGSVAQAQKTLAFGSGDAKPTSPPASGGFSAFASTGPATLGTALGSTANAPDSRPLSGASAFSPTGPSAFGKASNESTSQPFSAFTPAAPAFAPASAADASKWAVLGGSMDAPKSPFRSQPPAEAQSRTSVFGTTTTSQSTKSVFGNTSNIRGDDMDSPPPSPPSSPEPKAASPFGASVNPSSAPASSSGGAFSNLQVTPNAFRPASGFGAFDTPKSSPFFKSPEATPPVVSAFAPVSQPKTPTPVAGNAFGSPSVLGLAKPAFASIKPTVPSIMAAPATGGFGAFSGAKSGFGAFSEKKTSFSDLLKTGGEETKDPTKPALAFAKTGDEEDRDKTPTSVFAAPLTTPQSEEETPSISAFPPVSQPKERQKTEEAEAKDEKPTSESDDKKDTKNISTSTISDEASFANISTSSAASSFVEVNEEQERSLPEEGEHSDEDAEHSGDDKDGFLSDNYSESSYKDGDSANEESDEEYLPEERDSASPEPSTQPIPRPRSPSATPQPEPPRIEVSTPPDADEDSPPSPSRLTPVREPSTTPPGTPEKEPKPLPGTSPSPFGIGLGRPSTRPARSSPLANAVLHAVEEEEGTGSPPKAVKPPVSPKPVYGVLPVDKEDHVAEGQPSINKRPKTPPLLSTIAPPIPIPSTPILAPAIPPAPKAEPADAETPSKPTGLPFSFGTRAAATSTPNLFGGKIPENNAAPPTLSRPDLPRATTAPAAPGFASTSPFGAAPPLAAPAFMPPFSLNSATTGSPFTTGTSSIFGGAKPPTLPSTPPGFLGAKATPSPPLPVGGLFGTKPATSQPQNVFGASPPLGPTKPSSLPFSFGPAPPSVSQPLPTPIQTPPTPTPEAILEEGMQKECVYLVTMIETDLRELGHLAKQAVERRNENGHSTGGSRQKADLGVPTKWSFGDLTYFNQVLMQYEADLDQLTAYRENETQMLRELQSNILKSSTRKEEIARFNKAKHDKEFAKMLKARTLGPELTETQTHLRKSIRVIRDRVQKLESRLQENKKRLAQAATLKPTFRAPSLDTINRTYRNIELAIDQQSDDVARLAARISKLKVKDRGSSPAPSRDTRLPDAGHRRPITVTPNVAVTTAAALNAERSAHRLKKALLAVRKEPLLNTKAASAPPAPAVFKTPQKLSNTGAFAAITGPLFGEPVTPTSTMPLLDWNQVPEDNFNPTGSTLPQGRRGATGQRKHSSVPLKRTVGVAPPVTPPPAGFEWGPMPAFVTPPPSKALPTPFTSLFTNSK